MTATTTVPSSPSSPSSPVRRRAGGGLNRTVLGLEIRRLLRNRRYVVFTLVMPLLFFFAFGQGQTDPAARAYVLVSLAVYGAMVASTSGGASVAVERAQGWSRQLRLTPMRPVAYVATKVVCAMTIGLVAVLVELGAGRAAGVSMPAHVWLECGLLAWLGSLVFAAFGLFMGYLLPSENVMQILGPVLGLLSFLGGLFVPLQFLGHTMRQIAQLTPVYGVGQLARAPLPGESFSWVAVANVLAWTAVFVAGATWRLRRDTERGVSGPSAPARPDGTRGVPDDRGPVVRRYRRGVPGRSGNRSQEPRTRSVQELWAERGPAPRRYGWVWAGIWLVYLSDIATAAVRLRPWPRAAAGLLTLAVFCAVYLWSWSVARRSRRQGERLDRRRSWGLLVLSTALFGLTAVQVGQPALGMTVFITVMAMFVLPLRPAVAVVAVMVAAVEGLPRLAGWPHVDSLGFQVAVTALAMYGLLQVVQRNAQLAEAQREITDLAVTAERTRFARDLHDVLGHSLTVLTIKAELAGRLLDAGDTARARAEVDDVERLAREALADVRSAVRGYREVSLAGELASARAALEAAGIEADLPTAVDEVPGERRELFGWAVREGVTNVVRHSGARRCRVVVRPDAVEISDDGADPAQARLSAPARDAGNGLRGLRERADVLGARVVIGRSEWDGFSLRVGW